MRDTEIKDLFRNSNTVMYVAMSMMSLEKDTVIPELLYTIDREHILKLITIFGGETIYIPKPHEFKFYLECALAGYYWKCQGQKWDWIQKSLDLSENKLERVQEKVKNWVKLASKEELKVLTDIKEPRGDVT